PGVRGSGSCFGCRRQPNHRLETLSWSAGATARRSEVRGYAGTPGARPLSGQQLMVCTDCHSDHDWKAPGAPALEPKLGAGQIFPSAGLPGRVVAPNLTPDPDTGAGTWSDDALARAIREGVGHDGRALFPLMPYEDYHVLSDEDLAS